MMSLRTCSSILMSIRSSLYKLVWSLSDWYVVNVNRSNILNMLIEIGSTTDGVGVETGA